MSTFDNQSMSIGCVGKSGHLFGFLRHYLLNIENDNGTWPKSHNQWKRLSVDAPSRNVPSLSVFLPKICRRTSRHHVTSLRHPEMSHGRKSYFKQFSRESADRRTDGQTDRQTGPILYPWSLTLEGKKQLDHNMISQEGKRVLKWVLTSLGVEH